MKSSINRRIYSLGRLAQLVRALRCERVSERKINNLTYRIFGKTILSLTILRKSAQKLVRNLSTNPPGLVADVHRPYPHASKPITCDDKAVRDRLLLAREGDKQWHI